MYLSTVIDSYVRCSEIISYLNVPGVAILMTNGDLKKGEWSRPINVHRYKSLVIISHKKKSRWNWNELWRTMLNNVKKFWSIYTKLMIMHLKLINNNCMYIPPYWARIQIQRQSPVRLINLIMLISRHILYSEFDKRYTPHSPLLHQLNMFQLMFSCVKRIIYRGNHHWACLLRSSVGDV